MDRNGKEVHSESAAVLFDLCDVWREQHPTVRQCTWVKSTQDTVCAARLVPKNERHKISRSDIFPVGFTDHLLTEHC